MVRKCTLAAKLRTLQRAKVETDVLTQVTDAQIRMTGAKPRRWGEILDRCNMVKVKRIPYLIKVVKGNGAGNVAFPSTARSDW